MNDASYRRGFTVPLTPAEAHERASRLGAWWNDMIEGPTKEVGDVSAFDVPGLHHCALEVVESVPGKRVAWQVLESGHEHEIADWIGTRIVIDLEPEGEGEGDGTRVQFTHQGLSPELECHDGCSRAWDYHLEAGLRPLLTNEVASPITRDTYVDVARTVGASQS